MTDTTSSAPADATQATQAAAQTSAEATAAQAAPADPNTPVEPAEKKQPWFQARIDHLTREKYEAKRAQEQAEAEAKTLREQLAKAAQMAPQVPGTTVQAPTYQPPVFDQAELDRRAAQKAQEIVKQERFTEQCNNTYQAGKKEYGADFDAALANFKLLGGLEQHPELVEAATALPDGYKVLHHLGSNLDEAHRVLSLSPVQMAVEIARLSGTLKPKTVSQAPAPVKGPTTGSAKGDPGPDDNGEFQSQDDFKAWREKNRKRR